MMREILFRGKRLDNGEWEYGSLLIFPNTGRAKILCWNNSDLEFDQSEVDPATVGQHTGLYDTNGEPIFEGDIVEAEGEFGKIEYSESEAMFQAVFDGWCVDFDHFRGSDVEVIGNIHDSPGLLEEKSDG